MSKLKNILISIAVLLVLLGIGFVFAAWQEPGQIPPGGNVAAPINVSTSSQAKAGSIEATVFYDYDNNSYYVNPAGQSVFSGNVTIETAIVFDNNFKLEQTGTTTVTMYDSGGYELIIFDEIAP